jgi:kynurenine formamidase
VGLSGAIIVAVMSAGLGCSSKRTAPDFTNTAIIDLTHPYDDDVIYWPTSPGRFELKVLHRGATDSGYWYEANSFCTPEHGGTHLDAPVHFAEAKWSVAEIPVEHLVGPAVVIDVRAKASADPNYQLSRDDLLRFEDEHGRIPAGAVVVLNTGYAKHWPDRLRYLGDDTPGDASKLRFPSFGEDAVRWLIEKRHIHALGVDTASIDPGSSKDFPVHRVAGAANVVGLENLTNVDRLPAVGTWIVALPMKIADGSGAPVRVVAFVPR